MPGETQPWLLSTPTAPNSLLYQQDSLGLSRSVSCPLAHKWLRPPETGEGPGRLCHQQRMPELRKRRPLKSVRQASSWPHAQAGLKIQNRVLLPPPYHLKQQPESPGGSSGHAGVGSSNCLENWDGDHLPTPIPIRCRTKVRKPALSPRCEENWALGTLATVLELFVKGRSHREENRALCKREKKKQKAKKPLTLKDTCDSETEEKTGPFPFTLF